MACIRLLLVAVITVSVTEVSLALDDTGWCAGVAGTPVVACDDFDDYCPDPPCDDAVGDDNPDQASFLAVWASDGCHGVPDESGESDPIDATVRAGSVCGEWQGDPPAPPGTEPCAASTPFALRQDKDNDLDGNGIRYPDARSDNYLFVGSSHKHDLRPRIAQLDPSKGSVNGTDESPLVLQFVLDLYGDSMHRYDAAQTNRYIELTDGSDRAPGQVSIVTCPDAKLRPQAATDDGLDHSAIAIGMFAALDPEDGPCAPEARPITYRLSFYDGNSWYELKPSRPPAYATGDGLKVGGHLNYITMTITSGTIDMEIVSTVDGLPYNEIASAPRVCAGGFAAIHVGNGACLPSNKDDYVDNIALTGGVLEPPIPTGACCVIGELGSECVDSTTQAGCENRHGGTYAGDGTDCATTSCVTPPGACCLPDGSCTETDLDDCVDNLGGQFRGILTHCGDPDILCCPDPFADVDGDGDVDQDDFGVLQACLAGPDAGVAPGCECLNRDGDDAVDEDDWGAFEGCASGPDIPADRTCDG